MPRRIRPSERKNAFALYGFMSSMVRRWAPRMTLMPAVRPCTTILPRALMVRRIELFVALTAALSLASWMSLFGFCVVLPAS